MLNAIRNIYLSIVSTDLEKLRLIMLVTILVLFVLVAGAPACSGGAGG